MSGGCVPGVCAPPRSWLFRIGCVDAHRQQHQQRASGRTRETPPARAWPQDEHARTQVREWVGGWVASHSGGEGSSPAVSSQRRAAGVPHALFGPTCREVCALIRVSPGVCSSSPCWSARRVLLVAGRLVLVRLLLLPSTPSRSRPRHRQHRRVQHTRIHPCDDRHRHPRSPRECCHRHRRQLLPPLQPRQPPQQPPPLQLQLRLRARSSPRCRASHPFIVPSSCR